MKSLKFIHSNGWVTKIVYRSTMDDLVITQSNREGNNDFRQIYLFDEKRNLINELLHFLKSIRRYK